jgi:3-deoxy-7-phosphoheptulonate synthase
MNYTRIKKLPPAEQLIQLLPLSMEGHQRIMQDRREIKNILEGKDERLLLIVGPCSAWPKEAVLNYANKLVELNKKVKNSLKIIMRAYIQKPRTAKGWTGPVNQPDPTASSDIEAGAKYVRDMMIKIIELGLPIADEALFTHNAKGFLELLSWVAIGARSSEDQEHRIFASAIDCAVGMKNPTHGSLPIAINSIIAAQHSHIAVFDRYEVQTHGNSHAHLVFRGSHEGPNYALENIEEAYRLMTLHKIKNPSVIIDASHDNCVINGKKDCSLQPAIIFDVIESIKNKPELKKLVKGFMVESFSR